MTILINPFLAGTAGGGGGPGSLPVSSPLVWLAPDFQQYTDLGTTLVSADGDNVRQWNDQSGNGYHFTHSVSDAENPPKYRPGVTDARGKKCVGFEGLNWFVIPSAVGSALSSAGEGEIFFVFKNRVANGSDIGRAPYDFSTAGGQVSLLLWSTGDIYEAFGTSARKAPFAPGTALNTSFHTYNVWSKTNDYGIYLDNTSKYTDSSNTVAFKTSGLMFGKNSENDSWWFNAYVSEIVIFARKLNSTERGDMYTYLTT